MSSQVRASWNQKNAEARQIVLRTKSKYPLNHVFRGFELACGNDMENVVGGGEPGGNQEGTIEIKVPSSKISAIWAS